MFAASIVELMPGSGGGAGGMTLQEKAKQALDDTPGFRA
jgi:hypothetical protein